MVSLYDKYEPTHHKNSTSLLIMRLLLKLVLGAAIFATSTEAFSPPSRSRVLNDLKEMRMTGAGGAAQPDQYVEGESMPLRGRMDNRKILQYTALL